MNDRGIAVGLAIYFVSAVLVIAGLVLVVRWIA